MNHGNLARDLHRLAGAMKRGDSLALRVLRDPAVQLDLRALPELEKALASVSYR